MSKKIPQFLPEIPKLNQQGVVLITVLIVGMIVTMAGLSLADLMIAQHRRTTDNVFRTNAMFAAEAGIERALHQLNNDSSFAGDTSEQEFFNNSTQGRGVYQATVSAGTSSNEKIIISTGKVYRQGSGGELVGSRKVRVTVVGTKSEGYAVHTGPGGLIVGGSASITNTDVFVNGKIALSGSAKIGTNDKPLNVSVAHIACPTGPSPGASYAELCATGQPISITDSAAIYGSVCATGQTDSTGIFPGNGGQGLIAGCTADPVAMPTYDRDAHINSVTTTGNPSTGTYACKGSSTKSWPANLKLEGTVDLSGSCTLTITGNVYITGDLTIGGSTKIKVADSLGATRPVIIVDGKITLDGSGSMTANSQGTGIHFISFKSAATCGATCTSLSGNNLYNSQNLETISVTGSSSLSGMVFQAYWGKATLSGSGNLGSAIGQTVDLSGSGTVVFGTTLSSGTSTWTIRSYQQIFN